jgi:hypothetical protein
MAAGTNHVSLSCIPTQHLAPDDLLGLFACLFGSNSFPESGLRSVQVFWSGPEGLAQIGPCRAESPEWGLSELIPGAYPPLFSIILEGEVESGPWLYSLGTGRLYINGRAQAGAIDFDLHGIRGQFINNNAVERLALAWPGKLIETNQTCGLVVQLQHSPEIPDPPAFFRDLADSMRARFLKTNRDFSPDELRQAVDPALLSGQAVDGLKQIVRTPQDLAALLGLG